MALPPGNLSQILCQFFEFAQTLKRSQKTEKRNSSDWPMYFDFKYSQSNKVTHPVVEQQSDYHSGCDYSQNPLAILSVKSSLRLVTDLQSCIKAQRNQRHPQKANLYNLQQMAKTIAYIQEHEYNTLTELQSDLNKISDI